MVCHVMHGLLSFFFILSCVQLESWCLDEETSKQKKMDVARILVRAKYSSDLNENFNMEINNNIFNIKLVEGMHGPKRIHIPKWSNDGDNFEEINSDEDEDSID